MKPNLYVLRVDDHGLQACHTNERTLIPSASFTQSDTAGFAAWLERQPAEQRYRLVFDFADEHLQEESIPRVRGNDRRALLARRFAAHFGNSPVTWLRSLGRRADAPHQETVILHGLARRDTLTPWLETLAEHSIQLEAIASAALLLGHHAPRALGLEGSLLLVAFVRSGMRLVHVDGSLVRFTRLVAGQHTGTPDWQHEVERTRSYLGTQAGLPDGRLHTVVFDPTATGMARQVADAGYQHAAAAALPYADGPAAGGELGMVEAAQLRWLIDMPRNLHCRLREGRPAMPRLPRIIPYGTAAAVATLLALAAFRWADASGLDQQARTAEARAAALHRESSQLEAAHGPLPAPAAELVAVMERLEREQARHVPAAAVFARLSSALDASPGLALERLSWQLAAGTGGVDVQLALQPEDGRAADAGAQADLFIDALQRQGGEDFRRQRAGNTAAAAAGGANSGLDLRFRLAQEVPR